MCLSSENRRAIKKRGVLLIPIGETIVLHPKNKKILSGNYKKDSFQPIYKHTRVDVQTRGDESMSAAFNTESRFRSTSPPFDQCGPKTQHRYDG